jgi:myosin-1
MFYMHITNRDLNFIYLTFYLQLFDLEETRRERMHFLATLIQKVWKGHVKREHFLLMKRSQVIISSRFRGFYVSYL